MLSSQVVIGKVNADTHRELGNRFGVRGFPTLKWFGRGKSVDEPEDYSGGRTAEALIDYVKDAIKADTAFGKVATLEPIAAEMVGAEGGDAVRAVAKKIIEAAAEISEGPEAADAALYAKLAGKIESKGKEYIDTETARLERMLGSGSVAEDKAKLMVKKLNILMSFKEAAAPPVEAADAQDGEL